MVWALTLVNAVVTVLLLQNYGEVKTLFEAQDRQMTGIMELQIRLDTRLRRLEGRPSIVSDPTLDFRPVRPDR
ncbi:hypothetical protein EON77_17885 [bacterium]|nr:MAG: hypothetical protein EON77_17885 [bacterium]